MLPVFREIKKFQNRKFFFIYLKFRNTMFLVKINLNKYILKRFIENPNFQSEHFEKLIFFANWHDVREKTPQTF